MAELTCLNEASVLHNIRERYYSGLIYVSIRWKPVDAHTSIHSHHNDVQLHTDVCFNIFISIFLLLISLIIFSTLDKRLRKYWWFLSSLAKPLFRDFNRISIFVIASLLLKYRNNMLIYLPAFSFSDVLRPVLCGGEPLQNAAHLLREDHWYVQREETTWSPPSYLLDRRQCLQEHDAR